MTRTDLFAGYRAVCRGCAEDETEPELIGRHGRVWPFDRDRLAVYVEGTRRFRKLAGLVGAVPFSEGDAEGTVLLPNAALPTAAAVIGAPKKRAVSERRREQLRRAGVSSRFGKTTA